MLHDESLALHGGASGIRDEGLLDSALSRAVNLAHYGEPDFADLTAAYAVGLAKNHPFVDGNKRTGITSAAMFLRMNKVRISCSQAELEEFTLLVVTSHPPIDELAGWLKEHTRRV